MSNPIPALKFNNSKKYPMQRLPFCGKDKSKVFGFSQWNVPRTGGYTGGNMTGNALAHIYLQHLRVNGRDECGLLQGIVLDMAGIEHSKDPEITALRGQIVGFFCVLEKWIASAVKDGGSNLDNADPKEFLKRANAGLNCNEDELLKAGEDEE